MVGTWVVSQIFIVLSRLEVDDGWSCHYNGRILKLTEAKQRKIIKLAKHLTDEKNHKKFS